MKLITGWFGSIESPEREQIETTLRNMPGGANSIVILEKSEREFIQVVGAGQSGLRLEHWDDGRGYCAQEDPTLELVMCAVLSYALDDGDWLESVRWQEMEGDGKRPKIPKSRSLKMKGLHLVSFAILVLILFCLIGGPGCVVFLMPAIVPSIYLYIDLDRQSRNFSLPSPMFTILVNIFVQSIFIGLIVFLILHPPDEWYDFVAWVPIIGIMATVSFLWIRRLWYLHRLRVEGMETIPTDGVMEDPGIEGAASTLVYQYANGQVGRTNPGWENSSKPQKEVLYLPDHPSVHRLIHHPLDRETP